MSIVQEIFYILSNYPGGYRVIYDILYDSKPPPSSDKEKHRRKNTLHTTLYRLKKSGLVKNTKGKWSISKEGEEFLKSRKPGLETFFRSYKIYMKSKKQTIVIFDIPEKKRKYRDWFRSELIGFGFEPIQKSVWFGPVLPKEFIEYLDQAGILECIRFFKVSESDLI